MHIVIIASKTTEHDNVHDILQSEGHTLSYVPTDHVALGERLNTLQPDAVLYRDVDEQVNPGGFLLQVCGFSPSLLNTCPFLFTFRQPEIYAQKLYGLCGAAALHEPPDPMMLLAKITALFKSFEYSDEENILINTRHFMEMQFCATLTYTEHMVHLLRARTKDDAQAQTYIEEILNGTDNALHLASALCYGENTAGAPSHPEPEKDITLAGIFHRAIETADNRRIPRVHINESALQGIYTEFNHASLCEMIAGALSEILHHSQGAYITAHYDGDTTIDIYPRTTTKGAALFTLTQHGLNRVYEAAQLHDGDARIVDIGYGAMLRITLPETAGIYSIDTQHYRLA